MKLPSKPTKKDAEDLLSLRIFIGGIDPLNGLTSQMVLDRLPNTVSDVRLGTTYLHCTVQDAAQRAMVHKTLHNVKWKQCKLSVENSKDDFLTRLAKERTTSSAKNALADRPNTPPPPPTIDTGHTTSTSHQESLEPRRHWRVRRRFGAPVVLVDTRPNIVSTWADLTANRNKKQYRNRSIHIKFNDDTVMTHAQDNASEEGDSMYSDSESGTSEASSVEPDTPNDTYVWSSSSDDEALNDESLQGSVTDEEAFAPAIKSNKRRSSVKELKSDNEEDLVDGAVSVSSESHPPAFSGSDSSTRDRDDYDPEAIDFSKEMSMNESVLAQLFPDSFHVDTNKPSEPTRKKRNTASTMVRYDPTDQLAQAKYELSEPYDNEPKEIGDNEEAKDHSNHDNSGENSSKETEMNADTYQNTSPPLNTYVYEQGKLESVFKESREQERTQQAQSGAFSFGFDLPESADTTSAASVVLPHQEMEEDGQENNAGEMDMSQSVPGTLDGTVPASTTVATGPTLFEFPSEELLDSLTRKFFYGFEDGKRIAENLAEWRNDPKVRESWLERRAALTLDWKRKRKAALSQRNKREEKPHVTRPRSDR